jgi:hypothetical protein
MAQSAEIRHDVGFLSTLPLGSIIAWHRDLLEQQVLSLPPGWVECNGQTLEDPESPFNGHIIPNLNLVDRRGAGLGRDGGVFLRGGERSGKLQDDQLQSHTHLDQGHQHPRNREGRAERVLIVPEELGDGHQAEAGDGNSTVVGEVTGEGQARLGEPVTFGEIDVREGSETRPANMSVIWIMKVKQITAARALPAVLAHEDAPHGAVYVGADGRVGVGTDSPSTEFEVAGGLRLGAGATVRSISTSLGSQSDALASEKAIRDYVDGAATLGQRAFGFLKFSPGDADGTQKTVEVGFAPRVLWVTGVAGAGKRGEMGFDPSPTFLGADLPATNRIGSGPINGFADIEDESQITAIATIPVIEFAETTGWTLHALDQEGKLGGIIVVGPIEGVRSRFEALAGLPVPTGNGFAVGLEITAADGFLVDFEIRLHFLCLG